MNSSFFACIRQFQFLQKNNIEQDKVSKVFENYFFNDTVPINENEISNLTTLHGKEVSGITAGKTIGFYGF